MMQHIILRHSSNCNSAALQAEFDAQGTESAGSSAGRIVLLPTVVINDKQYRGRLDALSITKALCAGFEESTEPEVCLFATVVKLGCPCYSPLRSACCMLCLMFKLYSQAGAC